MLNDVDILTCLHVVYRTCIGRQEKEETGKKEELQISHAEFTDERPSSYHSTFLV